MIMIYIISYIILFIMNCNIFKKKINYVNLIITIWTIISVISMFGFYDMIIPNVKTYIYILCFICSFNIFAIIFYKTIKLKEDKNNAVEENEITYKLLNAILIILIIIMMFFAKYGIEILISGGSFSDIRDAYLNCENVSNKVQMFISLVLVPLGNAIGIYAIIDAIDKRKIKLITILYAIFVLENIIYTGGRGIILNSAIILIIALMDKYNNNIIKMIKENKLIILALVIIAIIIAIITLQRNLRGKGLLYNIYCYTVGNIHLLGQYINNPEKYLLTKDNLLFGQILFSGISYPIIFVLRLFGIDIKAGLYILYETTQKFVPISNSTTINNSVTVLVYALRDFGIFGIFIYSAVITLFYTYLYKRKQRNNNILNKAIYYYFVKCSIFLFSDFQFANTGNIFIFLYFILLYKYCFKKENKISNAEKKIIKIILYLDRKGIIRLNDKTFIKLRYKYVFNKKIDLKNPKTFNEKLQWLKLYDRKPQYTNMVDKYKAKQYVANIIGEDYIIPTLGIYNSFDEINFDELPNQFVIKCTHDSASTIICKSKKEFDLNNAKKKIQKYLKRNYYYLGREWPYKNVKPKIIIEKFMEDDYNEDLVDYKFMCFNGKVKCSFVCLNRRSSEGLNIDFYDLDWNKMPFERHYKNSDIILPKPKNYEEMVKIAEKLSKDIPFLRVDLYNIHNKTYFSELTFYPGSGLEEFKPEKYDKILGDLIELPKPTIL